MHYHLTYAETFEVVEGRLTVDCDGRRIELGPGQHVTAPIKAHHRFTNNTDHPVVFLAEIRPARRFEQAGRISNGLARDGRTTARGIPKNLWQLALVYEVSESYVAGMPLWLQKGIFGALAKIAHWRGIEGAFDRYLDPEDRTGVVPGPAALPLAAVAYIAVVCAGAIVSIREGLGVGGLEPVVNRTVAESFVFGAGAALAPGLSGLTVLAVLTTLAASRRGRLQVAGTVGLALAVAVATYGMLSEPIARHVFSRGTFDAPKAALVAALVALPALITALAVGPLLRRSPRRLHSGREASLATRAGSR